MVTTCHFPTTRQVWARSCQTTRSASICLLAQRSALPSYPKRGGYSYQAPPPANSSASFLTRLKSAMQLACAALATCTAEQQQPTQAKTGASLAHPMPAQPLDSTVRDSEDNLVKRWGLQQAERRGARLPSLTCTVQLLKQQLIA